MHKSFKSNLSLDTSHLTTEWKDWLRDNKKYLSEISYEREFVIEVLSRISIITPKMLDAQFGFKCHEGRNRRIDFLIRDDTQGYLLPIELDGLSKDQTHEKWNNFLKRQNDLVVSVAPLLRFTNKHFFDNKDYVIETITKYLKQQKLAFREAETLNQKVTSLKAELTHKEKDLIEQISKNTSNSSEIANKEKVIRSLEQEKNNLIAKISELLENKKKNTQLESFQLDKLVESLEQANKALSDEKKESTMTLRVAILAITLICVILIFKTYSPQPHPNQSMALNDPVGTAPKKASIGSKNFSTKVYVLNSTEVSNEHLNQFKTVCGTLASYKIWNQQKIYLNIGQKYPDQDISFSIPYNQKSRLNDRIGVSIADMTGRTICGEGVIRSTKGSTAPSIQMKTADQISIPKG